MDKISDKVAIVREKITLKRRSSRKNILLSWYESALCWLIMIQHRNPETQEFDRTSLRLVMKDGSRGWKYRKVEITATQEERMELLRKFIELNCKMSLDDFVARESKGSVYKYVTWVIEDEEDFVLCSDGTNFWIEAQCVIPGLGIVLSFVGGKAVRRSLARSRFWADFNRDYEGCHIEGLDEVDSDD
jgi:hypothetical protein